MKFDIAQFKPFIFDPKCGFHFYINIGHLNKTIYDWQPWLKARKLETSLTLHTDHVGVGCDRDTYSLASQRKGTYQTFIVFTLLIKIIDFYFPLFYYYLMTSEGGNVTYLSHGEYKLNYHPLNLKIFSDFLLENCGFFTTIFTWRSKR